MNIATRPISSRISGFHKMSPEERLSLVESFAGLDPGAKAQLAQPGNLDPHIADHDRECHRNDRYQFGW
jgi:hypothetical protein